MFQVSSQTVLVRPSLADALKPVTVTCHPDVANAPEPTAGIQVIWLTWTSDNKALDLSMLYKVNATFGPVGFALQYM